MAPGQRGEMHWSGFTGDAFKVCELLVKLRLIEESAKSIVGDGLNSGDELEHLDHDMCKSFSQNLLKPDADQ